MKNWIIVGNSNLMIYTGNPRNRYSDGWRSKKRVTIAKSNDYGGKVIEFVYRLNPGCIQAVFKLYLDLIQAVSATP